MAKKNIDTIAYIISHTCLINRLPVNFYTTRLDIYIYIYIYIELTCFWYFFFFINFSILSSVWFVFWISFSQKIPTISLQLKSLMFFTVWHSYIINHFESWIFIILFNSKVNICVCFNINRLQLECSICIIVFINCV